MDIPLSCGSHPDFWLSTIDSETYQTNSSAVLESRTPCLPRAPEVPSISGCTGGPDDSEYSIKGEELAGLEGAFPLRTTYDFLETQSELTLLTDPHNFWCQKEKATVIFNRL